MRTGVTHVFCTRQLREENTVSAANYADTRRFLNQFVKFAAKCILVSSNTMDLWVATRTNPLALFFLTNFALVVTLLI